MLSAPKALAFAPPISRLVALLPVACFAALLLHSFEARAVTAGVPSENDLTLVDGAKSNAVIVLAPNASRFEKKGAEDLENYIERMAGAALPITRTQEAVDAALTSDRPLIIIGQIAITSKPELAKKLAAVIKDKPHIRSDGIVQWREQDRLYLFGSNEESHYFAVAELLRAWGVRWFFPGRFGECVPKEKTLSVGALAKAYASPFEIRNIWIAWGGATDGLDDFLLRNMMNLKSDVVIPGHELGRYTKGLGKNPFSVPLTDPNTAEMIAHQVDERYAKGEEISLAMDDGLYSSPYARDKELMSLQWDKYNFRQSVTDPMLELLNGVATRLRRRHPDSRAKLLFFAYSNMFLPPARDISLDAALFGTLAPIDLDPIHAMDDQQAPEKGEYKSILSKWSLLTKGRLSIYDYDQSMLVWRDLPAPTHQAFARDVKYYRDAKVLGFSTESRMALATTFTNLYLRGRLMWNPDEDTKSLLQDFYVRFFGPMSNPMREYWDSIFAAWKNTVVTEHEYFIAPAIYTPELVERLGKLLKQAEEILAAQKAVGTFNKDAELYIERLRFVRLSYDTLKSYSSMVEAAASDIDYSSAVAFGEEGLKARTALGEMSSLFTSVKFETGASFWPGEVQQYRELDALVNGDKGQLIKALPLEWAFRRLPDGAGSQKSFLNEPVDLSFWRAHQRSYNILNRKDYPNTQWEMVRTDRYIQAQGVRFPDGRNFSGEIWYRTDVDVSGEQAAANPRLLFPGLFNECDLYLNGKLLAKRKQAPLWWMNDYRFEWDVPLKNELHAGVNAIALNCHNPHHMGGMFRRPFLYAARGNPSK